MNEDFSVNQVAAMKLVVLKVLLGIGLGIGATELALRSFLGLGNPPLLMADSQIGYRFQPNQKLHRFGRFIQYNQFSQRNAAIAPEKPANTLRILMVGDSIINGGMATDQQETIPKFFKQQLTRSQQSSVEVLNASAGSWGIGNRLAYLDVFGDFDSNAIILQIGTSDLTHGTSSSDPVGRSLNFPDRPPASALEEAWTRYLSRRLRKLVSSELLASPAFATSPQTDQAQFQQNMQMLRTAILQLQTKRVPVIVLFTPNREDLLPKVNSPRYKSEFFQVLKTLKVPVVDLQTAWEKLPSDQTQQYYADEIHFTVAGNRAIAQQLYQQLCIQAKSSWCSETAP